MLITKVIADVKQTIAAESNPELRSEGAVILRELETLREDMEDDCPLRYGQKFTPSKTKANCGRPATESLLLQRGAASIASPNLA